jgi:hypothetical protein
LGSKSETCVGSRVHLVGASISFEKNFYRLPFTPPSMVCRIGPSSEDCRPSQLQRDWRGTDVCWCSRHLWILYIFSVISPHLMVLLYIIWFKCSRCSITISIPPSHSAPTLVVPICILAERSTMASTWKRLSHASSLEKSWASNLKLYTTEQNLYVAVNYHLLPKWRAQRVAKLFMH